MKRRGKIGKKYLLSSVPLWRLDKEKSPIGFGSGCIISFPDFDYLLTVFHVAKSHGKDYSWAILSEFEDGKGSKLVIPEPFTLSQAIIFSKGNMPEDIDCNFAFARIPNNKETGKKEEYYYQEIKGYQVTNKLKRHKFSISDIDIPSKNKKHAFSGVIKPEIDENLKIIFAQQIVHCDYQFKETRDYIQVFIPPEKHQGHEFYQGCSGSPIIDDSGKIVSLLTCGNVKENEIYGIDMQMMLFFMKIEIGF